MVGRPSKAKKKSARNWLFRLLKALEALPKRVKQEDDLGTLTDGSKKAKAANKTSVGGESIWHQFWTLAFSHFSIFSGLFKSSLTSIFKTLLSICGRKENWNVECASQ
jgi:hypothetical protein